MVQNQHPGPIRSSGHKETTEEHQTASQLKSQGEGGNPESLLKSRILDSDQVSRAGLWDHDDFLCVASSKKAFDISPDQVRKVLDGLLTFSRQGDPTFAHGDGPAPQHLIIGDEGKADVKSGDGDMIVAELNGKTLIASRSATYVLLVEGVEGATSTSLQSLVQSFIEGLQKLTL